MKTTSTPRSTGWARQPAIEAALAARHLTEGTLVLYDVTSTYFEGRHCPLATFGYSRDDRRGNPQIVFGVLSNADGCPVAVEVFAGNTADPKTVASQLATLRDRFHLTRLVVVGDRGMITQARIEADFRRRGGRVDHGAAGAANSGAGQEWPVTAVPLRRSRRGGDHRSRVSQGSA